MTNRNRNTKASKAFGHSDRHEALLALLADAEQPIGAKPTLGEIQAWHLGQLEVQRAQEVKSHVARDSECYALWSELLAVEREAQKPPERHWGQHLIASVKALCTQPVQWGAAAVAGILIIIVWLPVSQEQDSTEEISQSAEGQEAAETIPFVRHWDEQVASSEDVQLMANSAQRTAFQAGLRQGLEDASERTDAWAATIATLPDKVPACDAASTNCQQQQELLQAAGKEAATLYITCIQHDAETSIQRPIDDVLERAPTFPWQTLSEQLSTQQELKPWQESIKTLADPQVVLDKRCLEVRKLIDIGFETRK